MNKTLILLLLICGVCFSNLKADYLGYEMWGLELNLIDITETDTDIIKQYAREGKICEVFGHQWKYVTTYNDKERGELKICWERECKICGKKQKRTGNRIWGFIGKRRNPYSILKYEWKDVKGGK